MYRQTYTATKTVLHNHAWKLHNMKMNFKGSQAYIWNHDPAVER